MGIVTTKMVWSNSRHSGTEKLMLLAIAEHVSDSSGIAWPSVARLARMCGVCDRQAKRLLKALQQSGELQIDRNAGSKQGTNRYAIGCIEKALAEASGDMDVTTGGDINVTTGGDADVTTSVTPASPEPLLNRHAEPVFEPSKGRKRAISVKQLQSFGLTEESASGLLALMASKGRLVTFEDEFEAFVAEVRLVPGLTVAAAVDDLIVAGGYMPGFRSHHSAKPAQARRAATPGLRVAHDAAEGRQSQRSTGGCMGMTMPSMAGPHSAAPLHRNRPAALQHLVAERLRPALAEATA